MRKKEVIMISVQKKLMLMRNKRSDKNRCAEEVDNDVGGSENVGCTEKVDDHDYREKKRR
jgi:hypothetical protein